MICVAGAAAYDSIDFHPVVTVDGTSCVVVDWYSPSIPVIIGNCSD